MQTRFLSAAWPTKRLTDCIATFCGYVAWIPFYSQRPARVDGAVLAPEAFVLRFFGEGGDDRLLLVNSGPICISPGSQPLLAPPAEKSWKVLWSSESIVYGGSGTPPMDAEGAWTIVGQAAIVMSRGGPLNTTAETLCGLHWRW